LQISDCRFQIGVLLTTALFAGCGVRPERSLLDEFFAASRLRDKTALAGFSTVTFEPLEQGIVVDYEITAVGTEGGTKRVTLDAMVKRPDGQVAPRTLIVLMQRDTPQSWKITGVVTK